MRLKSLHIKGFKSFANDTLLNFSEDVIGVVGPNGSGKSNIVDAIRWVLGEQKSKELRLEAMSDVLFNGTKTKKESASATVTLTFDNNKGLLPTEYQTVSISRILYRSGESEYRLNNVPCRLKDINSLLLDTGIGSNSYAIIALGMVDDILADKENARRRMFEQAAGILKYKMRKKETIQKLKNASEDLNRVEDLLFEIEGNLKSLEKQAKRTQKYLDLKKEYKELSIQHAIFSIQHLKQKYKGIADRLATEQDSYRSNDVILFKKQALLEKDKKSNLDKEIALSEQQKKLNELVYQIRTRENDKGLLNQKLGFKKQNKDTILLSIQNNELTLSQTTTEASNLFERVANENVQLAQLKSVFEESKAVYENIKVSFNQTKQRFDIRQKEKQELERQVFDLEKNVAIQSNTVENNQKEIQRVLESIQLKENDFKNISSQLADLQQSLEHKAKVLFALNENEDHRKKNIAEDEIKRDRLQDELNKIHRNLDSKQNEYDLLKSMIDNFEGFPESIRFLHEHWKKDLVLLSDIFDVEEKYKATIELYLEQYLNHFVVKNVAEAIQGISLLKNSQKGKANFFLLDQVEAAKGDQSFVGENLKRAIDLIKTKDNYYPLMSALLGNVYIFDGDVDQYVEKNDGMTILSASGTFLKQGFTISGGSVGLFEGKKIGRKQNLEKLAQFLDDNQKAKVELQNQLEFVKKNISNLKSNDYTNQIEKSKKEIQALEQDKIRLQHQIQSFNQFKSEGETKIKGLQASTKEVQSRIHLSDTQIKSLKAKIHDLDTPITGEATDLDLISEKMSLASETFNNNNINVIKHQNLISNFEKDKEFKELKISELTLKIEQDKNKLLSEDRERIDIEDQLMVLDRALQDYYLEKKNFQSTLSEVEQAFFTARNTINALEDEIRTLTKTQNALQQSIQVLKDQFSEQKFQIQSVGERLRIEFNIAINDVINQKIDESLDFETLSESLEKVKAKMQTFGDINPLAVEAYDEMKIRFDHIQVQRNDILGAKDSLEDTMKEIESTATGQFMEAFKQVRENFIDVFRSLFTEDDTCDLILLDPNNPLDSDIEIIAKPKGKKPKSLSQLSGGEKTLTATALLFALYLLKPAPFCIFDEVDAPLDDANIQKFNKIIQKFSNKSQFIVVTHNKSTMAEVNVLYGVYMVEPGVSAVSSVDFRSLKHEAVLENLN